MKRFFSLLAIVVIVASCSKKDNDGITTPGTSYDPPKPDTIPSNWTKMAVAASNVSDVFFTDNNNGWLTGSDGIYRSVNGGVSWTKASTAGNSVNIGAWGANKAIFVYGNGYVNYTNDGGASFQQVASIPAIGYYDCFYASANYVYLLGTDRILRSSDGGLTFPVSVSFNDGGVVSIGSLFFLDNLHGWATRASGLYATSDAGITWTLVNAITNPNNPYAVQFLNLTTGWYLTKYYNATLFKTTNGSTFSNSYIFPSTGIITDLHFFNATDGYVSAGNRLYRTTDGGATFTQVIGLGNATIVEIHFTDMTHGWAGCSDGTLLRLQ